MPKRGKSSFLGRHGGRMEQHCSCTGMGSVSPGARQSGQRSAPLSPPITRLTRRPPRSDCTELLLRLMPASPTITPLWLPGPSGGAGRSAPAAAGAARAAGGHCTAGSSRAVRMGSAASRWIWLPSAEFNWADFGCIQWAGLASVRIDFYFYLLKPWLPG